MPFDDTMNPPFTKNQRRLLRLFYTNPQKSFYLREIGRILGKKPGVFQRTLNRLAEEGLLLSEYRARARFFQANTRHPLYPEIKKIIAKTAGAEGALRELLSRMKGIRTAFLYGSFAKGRERADSDIDLLIVGKPDVEDALLRKLPTVEKELQREIHYKLYGTAEYRRRREARDPFLEEVLRDKKILLKGNPDAV